MIETYKLMTGKYDKMVTNSMPKNEDSTTAFHRGHSLKLYIQRAVKTLHQNFFSIRIASHWNNLPESVTAAPTTQAFKSIWLSTGKEHELIYNYRAESTTVPLLKGCMS